MTTVYGDHPTASAHKPITARPAPLVPPESLADWLITVRHLAEDVEFGLDPHATAIRLRALLTDMRATAYRTGDNQ